MIDFIFSIIESDVFKLIFIPLLIFSAKVVDVSLSTLGLIFTARGYKKLSSITSFAEIIVYLLAISTILEHLSEIHYFLAYAGGYAVGTYAGMWLEEKLSIGFFNIRVITRKNPERFLRQLKKQGYKPTFYRAHSSSHRVHVVHTVVRRRELAKLRNLISRFDRDAFYSIEDIRAVSSYKFGSGMKRVE
jgi:uncharacterized protein YebE (UPF0316 family)